MGGVRSVLAIAVLVLAACGKPAPAPRPTQPPQVGGQTAQLPHAATPVEAPAAVTAVAAPQPATPVFAAEGALIGRRDAPTVLAHVAGRLANIVPALAAERPQFWVRQGSLATVDTVLATRTALIATNQANGVALRLDRAGCSVRLSGDVTVTQWMPCEPIAAATLRVQAILSVLARADLADIVTIESLAITGTGAGAVVNLGVVVAPWRTRATVRATASGDLLGVDVADHNVALQLLDLQAFVQVDRHAAWRWHWPAQPLADPRTVLRVPVGEHDDPVQKWSQFATTAELSRIGPLVVRLAWRVADYQVLSIEAPVLSAARALPGAEITVAPLGPLLLPAPILVTRSSALQQFKGLPAGCLAIQLLDDVAADREHPAGSWAAVRQCTDH